MYRAGARRAAPCGAVFACKEEGLWEPTSRVSAGEIRHLRVRVGQFHFTSTAADLKDVESCAACMAKWVRKNSDDEAAGPSAASGVLPGPIPSATSKFSCVAAFADKMASAKLAGPIVEALFADVLALGAVDVAELSAKDWQDLAAWKTLRPLEVRRLARAIT